MTSSTERCYIILINTFSPTSVYDFLLSSVPRARHIIFPYKSTVTQGCSQCAFPQEQSLLFQVIYKPRTVCVHTLALLLCGKQARPLVNRYLVGQQKVKKFSPCRNVTNTHCPLNTACCVGTTILRTYLCVLHTIEYWLGCSHGILLQYGHSVNCM